ncbi:PA14 domain-containing protein [Candidatus Halobonum tyrrellensis]|uniref:PKD domain containing protein n=1 Tax=Candidatus Halobonum tyrrellensis G22 TaxID=1324957 RepID=V4GRU1_9EURY|nr:PA14 domain-containing protein [Candidatus Halobonum tyrrellensis]ESP87771.1 PKD domain containing protein [Candidatus Halobonum tyrrellensis G22]
MGLWGDERGQSTQIGAVLLFGFLVVSMATYQSTVVPAQNEDIEFSHSQTVQGDLQRVHDAALRTAATGVRQSTAVTLGTRYPSRTLFVNPPAPSGSLRTTGAFSTGYGIQNARATGEAGDYWDGDWRVVGSEALVYAPGYHEYRSPPETVVEGGLVYNRFDDATVPLTDGSLVDGRTVTLVALDGSRSVSRGGVESVGTEPLSVSTTTVPVRSADGDPIRLYVLTMASESAWRETLADELAEGNVESVDYYSNEQLRAYGSGIDGAVGGDVSLDRGQGAVVVQLNASRTYDLRMAKVGVGSGAETPGPAYLVPVGETRPTAAAPGSVTVEVRDAYNNPVSGATVGVAGDGAVVESSVATGADGRATFHYREPSGDRNVTFRIGDDPAERVEVTLSRAAESGAGEYDLRWDTAALDARSGVRCVDTDGDGAADECTVGRSAGRDEVRTALGTTPATGQAFVDLTTGDRAVAEFDGSEGNTDGDGRLARDLDLNGAGTTTLRAASVESSDELTARVVEGAYYRYYEGDYGSIPMPDFASETPTATGYAPAFDLSARERDDEFAIEYTAYLTVPETATYRFYTESDDGSRLYIDGERVVDNGGDHSRAEASGEVDLSAGEHAIRVTYYENTGDQHLDVSWRRASTSRDRSRYDKKPVPTWALRPRYPDDPLRPDDDRHRR